MQGVINLTTLGIALGFLVPGYIIGSVRSIFLTGRRSIKPESQIFELLALSTVNLAVCFPLVAYLVERSDGSPWLIHLSWLAVLVVIPVISGTFLGIAARKGWPQSLLHRFGMAPLHAMPTAWDWKFGLCEECWVHVTLTDGTKFAGYCGAKSFMSSDPSERDIYIESVFSVDDGNRWLPAGSGLYIAHAKVSTIEFWPINRGRDGNVSSQVQPIQPSGQRIPAAPVGASVHAA